MDILLNGRPVDALASVVHRDKAYPAGKATCIRLKDAIHRSAVQNKYMYMYIHTHVHVHVHGYVTSVVLCACTLCPQQLRVLTFNVVHMCPYMYM